MENGLYAAMKKAGCSPAFITYATSMLRYKQIIWEDWTTSVSQHEITVRLEDGYTITIRE